MEHVLSAQQLEMAVRHHERGEWEQAERVYRQALASNPNNLQAAHSAGVLALQTGRFETAVQRLGRAVELGADLPGTHLLIGRAHKAAGEVDAAIASYRRALAQAPDLTDAHICLGLALKDQGKLAEAEYAYRQALTTDAQSFIARTNLANLLQIQGHYTAALSEYETALAIQPDSAELMYNTGKVLRALGRNEDAAKHFQHALQLDENYLDAYYNLGNTLDALEQFQAAENCFCDLLDLLENGAGHRLDVPARAALHLNASTNLACTLVRAARFESALPLLHHTLERDPQSRVLHEQLLVVLPYRFTTRAEVDAAYLNYQAIVAAFEIPPVQRTVRAPEHTRLRIGYVSPDFRDHSVAFFLEPVLAHHDRTAFEVLCYSNNKENDATTARFKTYADHWLDAQALDDGQLAQRIADDGVDILVDLCGRTLGNRLGAFLCNPAPLQVAYLGYPTYTGVPHTVYRVTDAVIDPDDAGPDYEKPLRLPHSMFCYRPPHDAPAVGALPARTCGEICFGSFNQLQKLSPHVFALWAEILRAVPKSRLLLKAHGLASAHARARVEDELLRAGVDPERVEMRGGAAERNAHLAMYNEVDIALDTFPYNGATTSFEALWMGVPVVTLAGETHPSRMGASILSALGLNELIATSPSAYIAAACTLAADLDRLSALRANLRPMLAASRLCDEVGFTRNYETALRNAWNARPLQRGLA